LLAESPEAVFTRFAAEAPGGDSAGGAAGLGDFAGRLWDGAKEALRQLTYWQMKKRAAVVGKEGLGPLVGRLAAATPELRIHLIGHSFGGRLACFTLAGLPAAALRPASPVKSVLVLQGAFSHFAFADALPHDRSRGGALKGMAARVDGPLVVTHTTFDKAVGTFYPLASISARDDAAALEDRLYRWGAMGHDGAQAVPADTVPLGRVGQAYAFRPGRFCNLDGNRIITRGGPPSGAHSDILHPEIAWAAVAAAGLTGGG
ncbi:MAG: serine-threonine protein kinase, partial [Egibacteraceae bacterium]